MRLRHSRTYGPAVQVLGRWFAIHAIQILFFRLQLPMELRWALVRINLRKLRRPYLYSLRSRRTEEVMASRKYQRVYEGNMYRLFFSLLSITCKWYFLIFHSLISISGNCVFLYYFVHPHEIYSQNYLKKRMKHLVIYWSEKFSPPL